MIQQGGAVAAGHPQTAAAARMILEAGGNAFDAVVAAHLAACVAEPVLSSLGGGGFLLAQTAAGGNVVYDFFVQTPQIPRPPEECEFFPIAADFGTVLQEFHIGRGAIATPGTVRGLFAIQRDLCRLPLARLAEPALMLARDGVLMNSLQAYIFDAVQAIYTYSPECRRIYGSQLQPDQLLRDGELMRQPQQADCIEALVREGERLFYEGEIAHSIARVCQQGGGHLRAEDLQNYQVIKRRPLAMTYRGARLLTNPPPSSGGILIGFALKLLEQMDPARHGFGTAAHLDLLTRVFAATGKARLDAHLDEQDRLSELDLLAPELIERYRAEVRDRALASRGTTHISVIDGEGNMASLTTSNGEGCGFLIPGTGIMLNNMLGEEDLNPGGFHRWREDQRMTSMMAPSIAFLPEHRRIVLGSGGSNRIRSALLQVLMNLIDFGMELDIAVTAPRIHYERGHLSIEGGFEEDELAALLIAYPDYKLWAERNLFFGGVQSVQSRDTGFSAAGDPRRGGVGLVV